MPKFDVVMGNPPYKGSLHLKFLELSHNIMNNGGYIIWVHPARWLQDTTAPYKKNSDFNKYKYLPFIDIKIIPLLEATKLFKIRIQTDLIISVLNKGNSSILNENFIYKLKNIPLSFKRLLNYNYTSLKDVVEINKKDGIRVRIMFINVMISSGERENIKGRYNIIHNRNKYATIDGKYNGKDWTTYYAKNQHSKEIGSGIPNSIKFDSINEANNFINYTFTKIFQFFNYLTKSDQHVQLKYLPFMEDYTKPWTDDRLQEYFNISDEEMNYIKNTIEKYI
jgi:hypothetical protein